MSDFESSRSGVMILSRSMVGTLQLHRALGFLRTDETDESLNLLAAYRINVICNAHLPFLAEA